MKIKKQGLSLFLLVLVLNSLLLSSCKLFGGSSGNKPDGVQLPPMITTAEGVVLKTDSRGLNEVDVQLLNYAKDKLERFSKAFDNFGSEMGQYLNKIIEDAITVGNDKVFISSRDTLLKACRDIEAVNTYEIPAHFKNIFDQEVLLANRTRAMLYQILHNNGTQLPGIYDDLKPIVATLQNQAAEFFRSIDEKGLEASANVVPAVDWASEEARTPDLQSTFNVADLGLDWGSTRSAVMGVEGLIHDAYKKDVLSYKCHVYLYSGVRNYHFNEFGQMDSYSFDIDSASYDTTPGSNNIYEDLQAISPVLMYFFILDTPSLPQVPVDQGGGVFTVSFDPKAETVVMTGDTNDPSKPIRIDVTGKTAQ